jgi:hypothetical protein
MKRILFVALGLAGLMLPAMAAPRDDVLYGVSRCGGIADDRTWLDCVYGAAQPMRAKLGLPPAPASQQALVPPPVPGQAAPAMAAAAPPMINGRPMTEQEQKDFLDYKSLSVVPRSILKVFTPKEIQPEPATSLKSYKFDAAGYFIVTLANGETWRQDQGDTTYARWNKPAGTYAAQIVPTSTSSGYGLKVGSQLFQVNQMKAAKR